MPGTGTLRVGEFVMPPFDVTIATPMDQVRSSMRSYIAICAGLLLAMLITSVGIGIGLSRLVLRPLLFIRETAQRISSDNLSERIPLPAHEDELADLARLLNRMFDRLENSFTQIKRFAAEASHELKTPLSLIRLHGEKLLEDESLPPHSVDAILVQLEEVARLNQIIEEMLFLSRAEAGAIPLDLKRADPENMLRGFSLDAQALAEHQSRHFRLVAEPGGLITFEERWLRQVWLNLLTNALAATPEGGTVTMTSAWTQACWQVVIEDEGKGLDVRELPRIFDRFVQFTALETWRRNDEKAMEYLRSLGFRVVGVGEDAASDTVKGKDLIVISESVDAINVGTKYRDTPVPLLTFENDLLGELEMSGLKNGVDYGTDDNQRFIWLVNAPHPLAAGLSAGLQNVLVDEHFKMNWGKPCLGAVTIATLRGEPEKAAIFAYDKGATMNGEFLAPARRVSFFLWQDTFEQMRPEGLALFRASVLWAVSPLA